MNSTPLFVSEISQARAGLRLFFVWYLAWINIWLAQQPEWHTARDLSITTRSFGLETGGSRQYGEYRDGGHCSEDLKVRKQPSFFVTTSLWYKNHYLRATRTRTQGTAHVGLQTLKIQWVFSTVHRLICVTNMVIGSMATTLELSTSFSRTPSVAGRRPSRHTSQFTPPQR